MVDEAKGEISFYIADVMAPQSALPDGTLVSLTFDMKNKPQKNVVRFISEKALSFGGVTGQSIVGKYEILTK